MKTLNGFLFFGRISGWTATETATKSTSRWWWDAFPMAVCESVFVSLFCISLLTKCLLSVTKLAKRQGEKEKEWGREKDEREGEEELQFELRLIAKVFCDALIRFESRFHAHYSMEGAKLLLLLRVEDFCAIFTQLSRMLLHDACCMSLQVVTV